MTIAIGLRCRNGAVLASDSQITTDGGKHYQAKIFSINQKEKVFLAYAGVTDFARDLVDTLRQKTKGKKGLELVNTVKQTYQAFHHRHYSAQPDKKERTYAHILVTVKTGNSVSLFVGRGKHWSEVDRYDVLGSGSDIAQPFLKPLYARWRSTREAALAAIYALRRIKDFGAYCGGPTQIYEVEDAEFFPALTLPDATWGDEYIQLVETDFALLDEAFGALVFSFPDTIKLDLSGGQEPFFRRLLRGFSKRLAKHRSERLRQEKRKEEESRREELRLIQGEGAK